MESCSVFAAWRDIMNADHHLGGRLTLIESHNPSEPGRRAIPLGILIDWAGAKTERAGCGLSRAGGTVLPGGAVGASGAVPSCSGRFRTVPDRSRTHERLLSGAASPTTYLDPQGQSARSRDYKNQKPGTNLTSGEKNLRKCSNAQTRRGALNRLIGAACIAGVRVIRVHGVASTRTPGESLDVVDQPQGACGRTPGGWIVVPGLTEEAAAIALRFIRRTREKWPAPVLSVRFWPACADPAPGSSVRRVRRAAAGRAW
jgi:hypothetical protein